MRKNNLLTTIMAAAVAVVMIYTVSGCSQKDGQNAATTAAATTPAAARENQEKGTSKVVQTPTPTLAVSGKTASGTSSSGTSSSGTTSSGSKKDSSFTLYVTSKDGVNIRQKPSTSSSSIGMGDYGDSYTCVGSVMGEDGSSWYQVSYQGKTGYVSTAYASKNAPSGSSSSSGSGSSTDTAGTTSGTGNSNQGADSSDDQDGEAYLNLRTIYLKSQAGDIVAIKEQTNGDYAFRDDNGVGYTAIDEDYQWQDQYGNTYYTLEDSTHRFGYQLEQHTITAADGTTVTITEKADGPYHYRDENGVGYIDEGDGVWLDQYDNVYTE